MILKERRFQPFLPKFRIREMKGNRVSCKHIHKTTFEFANRQITSQDHALKCQTLHVRRITSESRCGGRCGCFCWRCRRGRNQSVRVGKQRHARHRASLLRLCVCLFSSNSSAISRSRGSSNRSRRRRRRRAGPFRQRRRERGSQRPLSVRLCSNTMARVSSCLCGCRAFGRCKTRRNRSWRRQRVRGRC